MAARRSPGRNAHPEQFAKNIKMHDDTDERVEFAIKLPGDENGAPVWCRSMPNFRWNTTTGWQQRREKGDPAAVETAIKTLETQIEARAKDICEKYINPPKTTDFACCFCRAKDFTRSHPSCWAGSNVQRDCRVTFVGPTTLGGVAQ